ncbi:hypothetical protein [Candidatus Borrarchaeum sp.]|uniref:hypothetical protein n=1 Tax=Candidatus Borrarchaeum sp. TaxID=2846742 RepID=UPI00257F1190|nr:hypothetical protein [Candidatus Borrarchaeum sp.]
MSAQIVTPDTVRISDKKLKDSWDIKMSSVQELVELANTLGVKIVFHVGKNEYFFLHDQLMYYAKD